ncbi:MAG: hypothetical protein RIQ81_2495 [Pseudomonadota bacterium]|jgi:uncharacterized protein (TIRG00374 family)
MRAKIKNLATTALKVTLVAALLWWMISGGKLNLSEVAIFAQNRTFLIVSVLFWLFVPVALGSFRWWLLLRGAKVPAPWWRTAELQMVGLFFNTTMPGSVSGDLVKAVYVVRDQRGQKRTASAIAIVLDRVVGLMGLFSIAGIASLFFMRSVSSSPFLASMAGAVTACCFGMLAFLGVVFYPHKPGKDPFVRLLRRKIPLIGPLFALILKVYEALRSYRDHPAHLLGAWAVSVVIQSAGVAYYWYTTSVLTGQTPALSEFAIVLPFGMIATVIPVAPGGLGVGHVAFEKLFALIGLTGGANVFNVIMLGQLALNLTGLVPYLLMRKKGGASIKELSHAVH